jgi:tetratricopeptide (TPR) repeat protein
VTDPVARILVEQGPLHLEELERLLEEADASVTQLSLDMDYPAVQLVDDRWAWQPALVIGRVFTHRLATHEVIHDVLDATADLDPIADLFEHEQFQRLADGSPVRLVVADFDDQLLEDRGFPLELASETNLVLPPGTLAALGVSEGDLVGLRLTDQGWALETVSSVSDPAVKDRLAALLPSDKPTLISEAVLTLCVQDPAAFAEPTAPLSEIIDDGPFQRSGVSIAPTGFDFAAWRFELDVASIADTHGLSRDHAVALQTLISVLDRVAPEEGFPGDLVPTLAEAGAALENPLVADALVEETVDAETCLPQALELLARELESVVPRSAQAAARWLRATAAERAGDIATAERELEAAESMDSEWPLTLIDLARIASDRGDAERALALLRRSGAAPDDPMVEMLQRYRVTSRPDLGRNEPCWCGSGRKYKKCHLGNEQLPLEERAAWLYGKAQQHVQDTGWRGVLMEAAVERSRYAEDFRDGMLDALTDPLVMDAVLFEGGALSHFLQVRGPLLPDDERALAEQWLLVPRSVFEVEEVRPGESVALRDLRTDERHDVRERLASRQLKAGQLVCAHLLRNGSFEQFFGGIEPISPRERDSLIELLDSDPDEVEVVAALTERFAPPDPPGTGI